MRESIIQLFWEVPIIFVMLLILTRFQGRRQISQLTYFDYITGITLGDVAAGVLSDQAIPLTRSLVAIVLLGGLSVLATYLASKSRNIRKITEGEPVVVIKEGKVLEKNLDKLRLDLDNFKMLLREKNIFNFADVEFAVMETDGAISLLKKAENETITRQDLGLNPGKVKKSVELIVGGVLDEQKLKEMNITKEWLIQTLAKRNISIDSINYLELGNDGSLYIDRYNDQLDGK